MPILIVAAVLAIVGIMGFDTSNGINKNQVEQEVNALLAGIPQRGVTLGSPRAPITVQVFADLECPTVQRFVVAYLPSIIGRWVRSGYVKLEYLSLETDTLNEHTFFRQEVAALAAGRQDKTWNFVLTFIHEQELEYTGYATNAFLTDIASQVPGMDLPQWHHDRKDALLSERVALGVHFAHEQGLHYTPSLLLGLTSGKVNDHASSSDRAIASQVETSLRQDVESLREETAADNPALHRTELAGRKEVQEVTKK